MAEQIESAPKKERTGSIADKFDKTNPFTKGRQFDETELKFDTGESLFVSKSFLSYASSVFERMFQSQFKESSSECVKLTGKNYDAFLDMLLNMHPRIGKPISGDKAKGIYILAHEYMIPTVLHNSAEVMHTQLKRINGNFYYGRGALNPIVEWLLFAETYGNQMLLSRAAERASVEPVSRISGNPEYKKLSYLTKIKILLYRLKRCDKGNIYTDELPLESFLEE